MINQPLLITDLDNTLYNWKDYYATCFRGMVHALSIKTGISEDIIINEFHNVYLNHQSIEYSFAVQEFNVFKNCSEKELLDIINFTKNIFVKISKKNLKPYDGVKETLTWANNVGILVIGVTNATFSLAHNRLQTLGLTQKLNGLAALESFSLPNDNLRHLNKNQNYSSKQKRWFFQTNEMKPNPSIYQKIITQLHLSPENIFVVGDSLENDIKPAKEIGAVGIWAKYGKVCLDSTNETLKKITPWDDAKISLIEHSERIIPDFVIESYDEIMKIIPAPQLKLPGF